MRFARFHTKKENRVRLDKYYKKIGMINIIPISKAEAMTLSKMGYKFHSDIMPTYTKYRHYFLIESRNALSDLEKLRASQTILNVGNRKEK